MNVLMIGSGRMAEAIIAGLIRQKDQKLSITIANYTDEERRKRVAKRYRVNETNDWRSIVQDTDVIISAAPPSVHQHLFEELSPLINGQLVITVAAGIDPVFMQEHLPKETPVCWIMPNTAASVQASMSTYTCGDYVGSHHRVIIEQILTSIGDFEELTSEQVHDLTAITGSAPAFLYLFCEALEAAALRYGVTEDQARKLVTKMVAGSAAMLEAGHPPSELREQVTTPGGSTAAGVAILEQGKFEEILFAAIRGTNEHSRNRKNEY